MPENTGRLRLRPSTRRASTGRRARRWRVPHRSPQHRPARPARPGKTHLAIGLGIKAAHYGHRVLFAAATDWVTRLADAHRAGKLPAELARLCRYGLIIIDEVGYLPFEQDAPNLFFQLVSSRYEHASLILTSNLPFSAWGGVLGDQVVAAAMIDRIVHHADVLTLKGASYRLRNRGIDSLPSIRTTTDNNPG
ncbi:MAG: ATP-binding protein [Propionibacteriaceae bacterium]